jgi:hypothetical protein
MAAWPFHCAMVSQTGRLAADLLKMAANRRVNNFRALSIENASSDSHDFNCSAHCETGTTSWGLPTLNVRRWFLSEKKSKISSATVRRSADS